MTKRLCNKPFAHQMSDSNSVFMNCGNQINQMTIEEFRQHLNDNDEEVLNDLAFYIDVNKDSALGSTRVDVGGNMHMRQLWEDSAVSVLMDASGNYAELNRNDNRYSAEGTSLLNNDGTIVSSLAHCDFMKIIPVTYGRVQVKTIGSTTVQRLWLSLVPLPGGYEIPMMVVGKFKCCIVDGKLRSLPGVVTADSQTVKSFWDKAQARSKNHGLAGLDFRNHLLFHMMSKYGWRDAQNCKGSDDTLIWGVGLDGTENTTGSADDGFTRQEDIKTGNTLSLGDYDGNVAVTDSAGGTCHSVNVAGFENPWGQKWEMLQGLCSSTTSNKVFFWRSNWMPTGSTPAEEAFANVDHVELTRSTTANATFMNIIESEQGQGVYMIPKQSVNGISYGDNYNYSASGQLWLFGGNSSYGSKCGLAYADSRNAWTNSNSRISARLAYYGETKKVSIQRLIELAP